MAFTIPLDVGCADYLNAFVESAMHGNDVTNRITYFGARTTRMGVPDK